MNYAVAVRSKGRCNKIMGQTLRILKEAEIPTNLIYIFCPLDEFSDYENSIGLEYNIRDGGSKGVSYCNDKIIDYFPQNHYIIQMDDDVNFILELGEQVERKKVNGKLVPKNFIEKNVKDIIEEGYTEIQNSSYKIWGLYPVCNNLFMEKTIPITYDLKFLIGRIFGFINDKDIRTVDKYRDDYERSILFYEKNNGIIRFNKYTAKADTFMGTGGLNQERTHQGMLKSVEYMKEKYPLYVREKKCKSIYPEIRLIMPDKKIPLSANTNMKIHYIFLNIGLEPFEKRKDYQDNIKFNSKIYPDYKIWFDKDIEDLISNDYPEYKDKIKEMPYHYLVDLARPLILNKEGGIYIDMDIQINKEFPNRALLHSINKYDNFNNAILRLPDNLYIPYINYCLKEWDRVNAIEVYSTWKYRKLTHSVGANALKRFAKIHKLKHFDEFCDYATDFHTNSILKVVGTKTY